ncbi:transposase [Streptomyces sp. NPDC057582]|uniref:transposase n=1 Tax=Streptomyces sp. NPDC057582 TaxID=3346174 RepID=UPI0036BC30B1
MRCVAIGLCSTFRAAIHRALPHATVVVDCFHLVRHLEARNAFGFRKRERQRLHRATTRRSRREAHPYHIRGPGCHRGRPVTIRKRTNMKGNALT